MVIVVQLSSTDASSPSPSPSPTPTPTSTTHHLMKSFSVEIFSTPTTTTTAAATATAEAIVDLNQYYVTRIQYPTLTVTTTNATSDEDAAQVVEVASSPSELSSESVATEAIGATDTTATTTTTTTATDTINTNNNDKTVNLTITMMLDKQQHNQQQQQPTLHSNCCNNGDDGNDGEEFAASIIDVSDNDDDGGGCCDGAVEQVGMTDGHHHQLQHPHHHSHHQNHLPTPTPPPPPPPPVSSLSSLQSSTSMASEANEINHHHKRHHQFHNSSDQHHQQLVSSSSLLSTLLDTSIEWMSTKKNNVIKAMSTVAASLIMLGQDDEKVKEEEEEEEEEEKKLDNNNVSSTTTTTTVTVKPFSAIPGPWPSLPLIGTGWQYFPLIGRYELSKLHEANIAKYHTYGPIFKEEYQWGQAIVHIYDPVDFAKVFHTQGHYPIRPANEFLSELRRSKPHQYPNVGLANLNGQQWLEFKRKVAPAITKLRTINQTNCGQNEICDDFLRYLWQMRDPISGVIGNIQEATYRLALESICLMCLDSRIGSFPIDGENENENDGDDTESESDADASTATTDGEILIEATKLLFESFNKLYYGLPIWKYFTTGAYADLERAESTIYEVTSKYIDREMKKIQNGETDYDSNESVLQSLLKAENLNDKEVKVTIIDFISGGIFTVSNSLVYLFYHLASNPMVQEKLYDEIVSIVCASEDGDDNCDGDGRYITNAHIAKMTYLKACVWESFRLNCPVPGIMRVTSEPLELSGYAIPANTCVFSQCMTTCRLEAYFKQPDRFWPERWLDPVEKCHIHPSSLLPFGYGSRMCVGKRYSENEIYLATARLIQTYRLELSRTQTRTTTTTTQQKQPEEEEELELTHAFIVIPAKPIALRISKRTKV